MRRIRVNRNKKVPEVLGNRLCGVWPYVAVLVFDALVHMVLFFLYGQTPQNMIRLFFSFFFFIYPLYYVADILWSLRPSVSDILSGKTQINRKYYMNKVQMEVDRETLLPVTVSVPVYMESNETIFRTLRESMAAVERYREVSSKEANVVVSDDGIAFMLGGNCSEEIVERLIRDMKEGFTKLSQQEKKAVDRIVFYREHGIPFVVRPAANRAGLFKKASNLNYTLRLGNAINRGVQLKKLLQKNGEFEGGYAEGNITTHEIILLLDKDSGVKEKIIEAIVPEFASDNRLAYVQCATNAGNLHENYYTYATGHLINNLFHNIWPCKAIQGFFVPLVGHNVFLRKSILEKSGLWAENRVSEDYDKAICFYGMGYHGKYAQLKGLEFTEYASRTFIEDTGKQRRYAYGLFEMIFDGTIAPGKVRGCDFFYMILYFFSVVNLVLLLPTVLIESYFGNIYLLWAGFFFCTLCFVFLPFLRSLVTRRRLQKEHSEKFIHIVLIAISFVGHSFSYLAGACRYIANQFKINNKPFPSTNVDQLNYHFRSGVKLLGEYFQRNPWFFVIALLCLDRGVFLLTNQGLEPMTKYTYCSILFSVVFVPFLLTPQLFGNFGMLTGVNNYGNSGRWNDIMPKNSDHGSTLNSGAQIFFSKMSHDAQNTGMTVGDIERFLASYQETLQVSLSNENLPDEILSEYLIESCLRKEPEGRKELYVLRRKKDDKRALLRITKDYPQEDALEEAKLLKKLDHPGIPKVFASYEKSGKKYLIREYLEGRTLYEIVTASGSLAAKDIYGIADKIADILSYLHTQTPPVIHRDIKPQNIIVGKDGSIRLIDFGIARLHKGERNQDTSVVLTLDYASPEQFGYEETTPLSDIYSLGVVLLFLATGKTSRSDLEAQIVNNRLRNLIEQCVAFNPKERIQSVEELRKEIFNAKSLHVSKRKRKLVRATALLAVSVCLSAFLYSVGFVAEKGRSEKYGYARGYENGYTNGYEAAPIFHLSKPETILRDGSNFGNMAVSGGAFAAQNGENYFYIADEGIWRMYNNGTKKELLIRNTQVNALSFYNGWLYYSSGNRILQTNIYTLETDVLCENLLGELYVVEDRFYIRTEAGLYQLDIETGETTARIGSTSISSLNADRRNLYFIHGDDRALYRSDRFGNDVTELANGDCISACLYGTDLYYSSRNNRAGSLNRVNGESGEAETLLEVDAAMLNVTENGIYYLDLSEGTVNRCSFDGRIREKVSKNRVADFNIAGDWIFYHNKEDGGRLWTVRLDGSNDHAVQ